MLYCKKRFYDAVLFKRIVGYDFVNDVFVCESGRVAYERVEEKDEIVDGREAAKWFDEEILKCEKEIEESDKRTEREWLKKRVERLEKERDRVSKGEVLIGCSF